MEKLERASLNILILASFAAFCFGELAMQIVAFGGLSIAILHIASKIPDAHQTK